MMKRVPACSRFVLLLAFLALVVLVTSCVPKGAGCEKPYIDYTDSECCLDDNDNSVCDFQETAVKKESIQVADDEPKLLDKSEQVVSEVVVDEDPIPVVEAPPETIQSDDKILPDEEVDEENIVVVEQTPMPSNFNFDLSNIKVSKSVGELEGQLKSNNFYLTTPDVSYDNKVRLEFVPECLQSNINPLFIIVNGHRERSLVPKCEQNNQFFLTKNYLKTGLNTLVFDTVDKQYFIDDIYVVTAIGSANPLKQKISRVLLNAFTNKIEVDNIDTDVQIRRKQGFDVILGKNDLRDLMLSFDADEAVGELMVEVNSRMVFHGRIEEGDNEISIPEDVLVVGRNNFFIIGE